MVTAPLLAVTLAVTSGDLLSLIVPIAVGGLAVFCLLPRPKPLPIWVGLAFGLIGLVLTEAMLLRTSIITVESLLFHTFAGLAVVAGVFLISLRNPARAALSFTLVVLSSCGIFLLLAAPFMMAATIIIYAGAIIVTFLFVLMLAHQDGPSDADARSREPHLTVITGGVLLTTLLYVLNLSFSGSEKDKVLELSSLLPDKHSLSTMSGSPGNVPPNELRRDPTTGVPHLPAENTAYLGKSLFTDFLLPVELGGLLLLVAVVGSIAISQRGTPTAKAS